MSYRNPILIVHGEPNSVFFEIFFKSLKAIKIKSPIILITSIDLLKFHMKKMNFKKKIKLVEKNQLRIDKLENNFINVININYKNTLKFEKISSKSNKFIKDCFQTAFFIIKKYKLKKFINGPVNKKIFLKKSFPGITEYISSNFKIKKNAMLIYNKNLSVCPLTTHVPLKQVSKIISKKLIIEKVKLINEFYKVIFKKKPRIAVLGLNPHCETIDGYDEDDKIIKPSIKLLKKNFSVFGPFSADTMFLRQNRSKYDVVLGMYHDQVLTPSKTLFEYDAINITLGLPFIRISPDHGPNEKMLGKNLSNPLSLLKAISFLDKN